MFQKALANPTADARLDRNAVGALLAPLDTGDRLWTLYFAGRFEDLRGHTKEATDYYHQCEGITDVHEGDRVLPFQELRGARPRPEALPPEDPEEKDLDY